MDQLQCCRTCLATLNLNLIFLLPEYHEKYSEVILEATGVKINYNDSLPQQICTDCIIFINKSYKFRKKCQQAQTSLLERLDQNPLYSVKIEGEIIHSDEFNTIDISDFINFDESKTNESNLDDSVDGNVPETVMEIDEPVEKNHKRTRSKEKTAKRSRVRKADEGGREKKVKKNQEKEEIECEYCHKVLTSKLSLRNHYKIHTGFDVVCEHCGKKFITRRLLLMHCKAKHGYEKTDKCSYCDYRASNAEQVKIHERLHTGERPYVCGECSAGFHRKSSYLQHVATHLPEKTVPCTICPARFKSVTLMRIHASRHRAPAYTYKCLVCTHSFARRRNVARHLTRIHAMQPLPEHIERTKCA